MIDGREDGVGFGEGGGNPGRARPFEIPADAVKMPRSDGKGFKYVLPNGEVILPDHEIARRKRLAAFLRMSPVERDAWAREYVAAAYREQWASLRKVREPKLISPLGAHEDNVSCTETWDACSSPWTVSTVLKHFNSALAWLATDIDSPFRRQLDAGEPVQMVPEAMLVAPVIENDGNF
jgi:hypothetical protein